MTFHEKLKLQMRCIVRYAKSLGISDLDVALDRWVETGCAKRWAEVNK